MLYLQRRGGSGIATHGENGAERETLLSVTVQIVMIVRHTVLLYLSHIQVVRVCAVCGSTCRVVSLYS
jgi:hypothetical protein